MAKFHAEWSAKIADAMIPYLVDLNADANLDPEKVAKNKALHQIMMTIREWAEEKAKQGMIIYDVARCNRTYTRFKTPYMDAILPDTPGAKSGWNTGNHYFYEVLNQTGKSIFVQLAISAKDLSDDQKETCDRINELNSSAWNKWQYSLPFRTATVTFKDINNRETIFTELDGCLQKIHDFEKDLKQRLQQK